VTYNNTLTPTEQHIADLAAQGKTNRQIGQELKIAEGTIRTHISKILLKLKIKSRKDIKRRMI
jgi:DNA-binding NarL/FixJ family response regulator